MTYYMKGLYSRSLPDHMKYKLYRQGYRKIVWQNGDSFPLFFTAAELDMLEVCYGR